MDQRLLPAEDAQIQINAELKDTDDEHHDDIVSEADVKGLRRQFPFLYVLLTLSCVSPANCCAKRASFLRRLVLLVLVIATCVVSGYIIYGVATASRPDLSTRISPTQAAINISSVLNYVSVPLGYHASVRFFEHSEMSLFHAVAERHTDRRMWTRGVSVLLCIVMASWLVPSLAFSSNDEISWFLRVPQLIAVLPAVAATLQFLFHLRLLSETVDNFIANLPSMASVEEVLKAHIRLRRTVKQAQDTWHSYFVLGGVASFMFAVTLLINGYMALTSGASVTHDPNLTFSGLIIALVLFMVMGIMLMAVASVNDKNETIRLTIIDNQLFEHAQRTSLLYHLELAPLSFAVVGVHLSVGAIARLMLTVFGAFVPLLLRTVLGV